MEKKTWVKKDFGEKLPKGISLKETLSPEKWEEEKKRVMKKYGVGVGNESDNTPIRRAL